MLFNLELQDSGLLILRVVLAVIFLYHGGAKLFKKKIPASFRVLGMLEVLGGISILIGFLTELSSIGLSVIMLGAIYLKIFKWKISFSSEKSTGWEFDLVLLAMALALLVLGPGNFSLDFLFGI